MGVDYRAVLYVGKEFNSSQEAEDFYLKHFELSDEDKEIIEDSGFVEYMEENGKLDFTILNFYTSDPPLVLGINIGSSIRNPDKFAKDVCEAIAKWKELILEVEPKIIHTVCVW